MSIAQEPNGSHAAVSYAGKPEFTAVRTEDPEADRRFIHAGSPACVSCAGRQQGGSDH